jgi:hypothetical protein
LLGNSQTPETVVNIISTRTIIVTLLGILLPYAELFAQSPLPAPSRTIYKCQVQGRISYSDEPCLGAQRLNITLTRGVDRLSGPVRTGKDVAQEIRSEQFAKAAQPLTGMSASEFATTVRRNRLSGAAKSECRQLESSIIALEQTEQHTPAAMIAAPQQELYLLRKRYKALGC